MSISERLRKDFFLQAALAPSAFTTAGGAVLVAFLLVGVPMLRYALAGLIWRGAVIAAISAVAAAALTWRLNLPLLTAYPELIKGQGLSAAAIAGLREVSLRWPLRNLIVTITLWPATMLLVALWVWKSDVLDGRDTLRALSLALLYSLIYSLIIFYASRFSVRRMAVKLGIAGVELFTASRPGPSIRIKLIASFICLAAAPLVAGVVVTDAQREWSEAQTNLDRLCRALEEVQAAGTADPADWPRAIASVSSRLPFAAEFKAVDGEGAKLAGWLDPRAGQVFRRFHQGQPLGCARAPVPGERRFVAARWFANPGIWLAVAADPFPPPPPFWNKFGPTLALILLVVAVSAGLGYHAALDVAAPLAIVSRAARRAVAGDYRRTAGFLPDDELGELTLNFNSLIASFQHELARSSQVVDRVRDIIAGLTDLTDRIQASAARQRETVDEQSSLASQATAAAEKVIHVANEIQDRARLTHSRMVETSNSAREVEQLMKEVITVLQTVSADSEHVWNEMQALELNYRRMEEVVAVIDDIAERTEILALNASLEAGGKKEDGGRFSVVAGEIQRLSERITEQTVNIKRLFKELRRASMAMAQAIDVGRERAKAGPEWVRKLGLSLEAIQTRASSASGSMNEIVAMTDEQAQGLEQMKFMVAEVQAVARVIEEVTTATGQTITDLHHHAQNLQELVAQDSAEPGPMG